MEGGSIAPASLPSPPPAAAANLFPSSSADGAGNSSLYIVLVLVAVAVVATLVIRCLMTCHCEIICCGWQWSHPSAAVADVPLTPVDGRSVSNSGKGDAAITSEREKTDSTAGRHSSSTLPTLPPECAVCLSPLQHGDELRLLPACAHVFHALCVDTWLHTTPSCPLCRTSVTLPVPPTSFLRAPPGSGHWIRSSGSFRIESSTANKQSNTTGRQTKRRDPAPVPQASVPPVMRTYSIGLTDEEVEAVVAQIGRRATEKDKPPEAILTVPQADDAAEGVGSSSGRSGRWLWNYIDRFASSASSSMRFSGRWSRRYDAGDEQQQSWDLEGSHRREEEDGITYNFYKWLMGE